MLFIALVFSITWNVILCIVVISAHPICTTKMKMGEVSTSIPSVMIVSVAVLTCADCAPLGDAECEQCQKLRLCVREGSEQPCALADAPSASQVSFFL